MRELLEKYMRLRAGLTNSASSIGHETVIRALRDYAPRHALEYLENKIALNETFLTNQHDEVWMYKMLNSRIRLYKRVIKEIQAHE